MDRFAFIVELPDSSRDEFRTADESLSAEQAVERLYEELPNGTQIVIPIRGDVPGTVDLSPPSGVTATDTGAARVET